MRFLQAKCWKKHWHSTVEGMLTVSSHKRALHHWFNLISGKHEWHRRVLMSNDEFSFSPSRRLLTLHDVTSESRSVWLRIVPQSSWWRITSQHIGRGIGLEYGSRRPISCHRQNWSLPRLPFDCVRKSREQKCEESKSRYWGKIAGSLNSGNWPRRNKKIWSHES